MLLCTISPWISKQRIVADELAILDSIPARDSVLDGIRAIDGLKERLRAFLEPFRASGRVVTRQDIDGFFASVKEGIEKEKSVWS